jgi:adenosylhomocysteine nucleosidase
MTFHGRARRMITHGVQIALLLSFTMLATACEAASGRQDAVRRVAVMSAFAPEWQALQARLTDRAEHVVNGTVFVTGAIEKKPVVLFLSGISMVNAAMTAQLVLDRFNIEAIVFSGIAGGVDPALNIGDVVVPDAWSQYLEAVFAREVGTGGYQLPTFASNAIPNFGMIFPQPVAVARGHGEPERKLWFPVDPALIAIAHGVAETPLARCSGAGHCLARQPRIIIGGNGVSGQAFVDNGDFRDYAGKTFNAKVLDMESAAVAHVAYANGLPFIAFRSLSDLAGGGEGENEIGTFFELASNNSAAVVTAFLKALP